MPVTGVLVELFNERIWYRTRRRILLRARHSHANEKPLAAVASPVCLTTSRTHDYANPVDKIVAFAGEGLAAVMAAKFCKIPWMKH